MLDRRESTVTFFVSMWIGARARARCEERSREKVFTETSTRCTEIDWRLDNEEKARPAIPCRYRHRAMTHHVLHEGGTITRGIIVDVVIVIRFVYYRKCLQENRAYDDDDDDDENEMVLTMYPSNVEIVRE